MMFFYLPVFSADELNESGVIRLIVGFWGGPALLPTLPELLVADTATAMATVAPLEPDEPVDEGTVATAAETVTFGDDRIRPSSPPPNPTSVSNDSLASLEPLLSSSVSPSPLPRLRLAISAAVVNWSSFFAEELTDPDEDWEILRYSLLLLERVLRTSVPRATLG